MAKIVKVPLVMKNGEKVTDMKSLKENFDAESVISYFLNGKLEKWLTDRYYEDEAEAISGLDKDDPALTQKLCEIFGIKYAGGNKIDPEEIAWRSERLARLKQLTDDEDILRNIDATAFDQEELAELYDRGTKRIFLCEGEFRIPKSKRGLEYTLLGGATAEGIATEAKAEEVSIFMPTAMEDVEISEPIELNSTQKKTYQNARVKISSMIRSSGFLSFENCEITCGQVDKESPLLPFLSMLYIRLDGGNLQFKNCRIEYESAETESTLSCRYFIGGKHAKVLFEESELIGGRGLINSMEDGEIVFKGCTGQNVSSPVVSSGREKLLRVENCRFTSSEKPALPEEAGALGSKALLHGSEIQIIGSTFEGFTKGVIGFGKAVTVADSTFTECAGVINGSDNDVTVRSCRFTKCIHSFKDENLNLIQCRFEDCYGNVEAAELRCEGVECHGGYMWFRMPHYCSGRGNSQFANCTFENISRPNALQRLGHSRENGFRYFLVEDYEVGETLRGVDALIDAGHTGKITCCRFLNVDTGNDRFVISCGKSTEIERSVFDNCVTGKDILDRQVYTCFNGATGLMSLFDTGTKRQATYYIKSCKGIS